MKAESSRRWPPPLAFVIPLVALAAGCGTRFIDLDAPPDARGSGGTVDSAPGAGTTATCEPATRADGSQCKLCFSTDGMLVMSDCAPLAKPPDAGMAATDLMCVTKPTTDNLRCLACFGGPNPAAMVTPCLQCKALSKTDQGDLCRTCVWDDQATSNTICLQCFDATGTKTTFDNCDALRPELTKLPATKP